jgi:ParB family transcriptional regulator, chromosome partitioning protein
LNFYFPQVRQNNNSQKHMEEPPVTQRIALDKLEPMPGNREFGTGMDAKSIKELADSIKEHGIRQDLEVRPHPTKKGCFEIFRGVRRLTAAQTLGLKNVPCKVFDLPDAKAQELWLIENVQRVGVHEIEEARGYAELLAVKDDQGKVIHTKESIADKIGKSVAFVYARLKMLQMPDVAQESFLAGKLNASVALLLARIPDPKKAQLPQW